MAIHLHLDALRFDDPSEVVAGALVTGTLSVVATSAGRMAPIEGVLVVRTLLEGVSESRRYPPVILAAARRIPAGEVQVPFAWQVPIDAPPTFELGGMFCDARLLLRFKRFFVSEFPEPVVIGARAPEHGSRAAAEASTADLACALPSRQLRLGERVEVEVRRTTPWQPGADVDAELLGVVTRRGRKPRRRALAIELIATREVTRDGDRERSAFFVPHNLPTTFASEWLTAEWKLRITAHGAADQGPAASVELPVGVFGAYARQVQPPPPAMWRAPSDLAGTATATLGRIAHEIGWDVEHVGDPQREWAVAITHPLPVGRAELRLARGPRVATLTGSLLELGLGIGLQASDAPRRGASAPLPGGVRGDERTIWLHAVDAGHAEIADLALRPVLRRRLLGGPLRVSDDEIVVGVPAVPVSAHVVRTLARDLMKVAQAVQRLRARLGPPSHVAVDPAALARLGGDLSGSVYLPTLALRGRVGSRHVATCLAGARTLRIGLGEHTLARAALLAPPGQAPSAAAQALTARWPAALTLVALAGGDALAELDLGTPATLAPGPLREAFHAIGALLDALGPGAGPYR